MAEPSFVAAGAYLDGSAANAPVAVPAGTAAGQVAVVSLFMDGVALAVNPAPPPGFQAAPGSPVQIPSGSGSHSLYVWWKRLTAGDTGTWTFTWTGSRYREAMAATYTDVVASGDPWDLPVDTATDLTSSTVTPPVDVTSLGADRRLVWSATNWGGGTWTAPTGFTKRAQGGAGVFTTCDRSWPTAGNTGAITGTCTSSDKRIVWLGALIGTTSGSATQEAQAAATATATLTGQASATKPAGASRTIAAARTAAAQATRPASATSTVTAARSADASAVKPAAATSTTTATQTADAATTKLAAASLQGTASMQGVVAGVRPAGGVVVATTQLAADVAAVKPVDGALQVSAALAAAVEVSGVQEALAAASVTAVLSASVATDQVLAGAVAVEAALAATAVPARPAAVALTATAALAGAAEVARQGAANLSVSAALSGVAAVVKPLTAALPISVAATAQAAGPETERPPGLFGASLRVSAGAEGVMRVTDTSGGSGGVQAGSDW